MVSGSDVGAGGEVHRGRENAGLIVVRARWVSSFLGVWNNPQHWDSSLRLTVAQASSLCLSQPGRLCYETVGLLSAPEVLSWRIAVAAARRTSASGSASSWARIGWASERAMAPNAMAAKRRWRASTLLAPFNATP